MAFVLFSYCCLLLARVTNFGESGGKGLPVWHCCQRDGVTSRYVRGKGYPSYKPSLNGCPIPVGKVY